MDSTLGYVYCVRCDDHSENMYKVGSGKCIDSRLKSLNTAGVPSEFKLQFAKKIADYKNVEKTLHKLLSTYRVKSKKEFFVVDLAEIKKAFDSVGGNWYGETYYAANRMTMDEYESVGQLHTEKAKQAVLDYYKSLQLL
jgi:hypothetical protein